MTVNLARNDVPSLLQMAFVALARKAFMPPKRSSIKFLRVENTLAVFMHLAEILLRHFR